MFQSAHRERSRARERGGGGGCDRIYPRADGISLHEKFNAILYIVVLLREQEQIRFQFSEKSVEKIE